MEAVNKSTMTDASRRSLKRYGASESPLSTLSGQPGNRGGMTKW